MASIGIGRRIKSIQSWHVTCFIIHSLCFFFIWNSSYSIYGMYSPLIIKKQTGWSGSQCKACLTYHSWTFISYFYII